MKRVLSALVVLIAPVNVDLRADMACINHPARDGDIVYIGPVASSTLLEGETPETVSTEKYGIHRAFDRDRRTAWSEGAEGSGTGVEISFAVPVGATRLRIVNGYAATSRLFMANNRVKDLSLQIRIGVMTDVGQCHEIYTTRLVAEREITLADTDREQTFPLNVADLNLGAMMTALKEELVTSKKLNEYLQAMEPIVIGLLTIRSVYPGETYNDTCIAEIAVD